MPDTDLQKQVVEILLMIDPWPKESKKARPFREMRAVLGVAGVVLVAIGILCLLGALVLMVTPWRATRIWNANLASVSLVASNFFIVMAQVTLVVRNRRLIWRALTKPHETLSDSLYLGVLREVGLVESVSQQPFQAILLACWAVRHRLVAFRKRIALLVAPMPKIGLIGPVAALYLAWSQRAAARGATLETWVAFALAALYLYAFHCHSSVALIEKQVQVLKTAKKLAKSRPES
ncbi:MAG: hypothetical protein AB1714_01595 [Acidobacteriota bacterium]